MSVSTYLLGSFFFFIFFLAKVSGLVNVVQCSAVQGESFGESSHQVVPEGMH